MRSIYKKEIAAYFNSLSGYLAIGLFLLVTGLLLWVFPDTSIPANGYASLESFFQLSPYLFLFLIPAITMRSIAGERTAGTWELLITRPLHIRSIVLGKYLGSFTLVILAIVPTVVYYVAVYRLALPTGNVDTGAVIGSYMGLLLLGAAFTAIGLFASSLSDNVIVAFLIALFLCFVAFYAFDALSGLPILANHSYKVSALGIQAHYEAISRGVLDSRDLAYFVSIIFLFLWASYALLAKNRLPRKRVLLEGMALVGVLLLINSGVNWRFTRVDFTAEKRFTLTPLAVRSMENLEKDVHITVLLEGNLPAGFARLKRATTDLLNDLKAYSGGRLTFSFANPLEGNAAQQRENIEALADWGISPTNLSVRTETGMNQQLIFPAALVAYGDVELPVSLLQQRTGANPEAVLNHSMENLEYAFVSVIRKLTSGGRPLVGFTEGHGELAGPELHDAVRSLMDGYEVGFVNLDSITMEGLNQLAAVIVAKPTRPFSEAEKFKLDRYVMQGGSVLWAIDQSDAALDSLRSTGEQLALARQLNLDDLLFTYGVRFNYDLVADLNCAPIPLTVGQVGGQPQIELAPWLFYPVFVPQTSHPLLKNLDGIRSEFAGTLDTIAVPGIRKTVMLQSSPFSRLLRLPATLSLQLAEETPDPAQFKNQPYPVAALLEGEFPSVFANRPVPEGIDAAAVTPPRSKPAKMIAIADGDVFKGQLDPTDGSPYPLGWDRYTEQQYANKSFLLNAIDYLTDEEDMISLRDKELKLRLLDQVKLKEERLWWQLGNVVLPPLLLLLLGFAQYYIRKRRYNTHLLRKAS